MVRTKRRVLKKKCTHRLKHRGDTHRLKHRGDTHRLKHRGGTHRLKHRGDTHRLKHRGGTHRLKHRGGSTSSSTVDDKDTLKRRSVAKNSTFIKRKVRLSGEGNDYKSKHGYVDKDPAGDPNAKAITVDKDLKALWDRLERRSPIYPITLPGQSKYVLNGLYKFRRESAKGKIMEISSVFFDGEEFPQLCDITNDNQAGIMNDLFGSSKNVLSCRGPGFTSKGYWKIFYDFETNTFWLGIDHPSVVDDQYKLYYNDCEGCKPNELTSVDTFNELLKKSIYTQLKDSKSRKQSRKGSLFSSKDNRKNRRVQAACIQMPSKGVSVTCTNTWYPIAGRGYGRGIANQKLFVSIIEWVLPVTPVLKEWSDMIRGKNASDPKIIQVGVPRNGNNWGPNDLRQIHFPQTPVWGEELFKPVRFKQLVQVYTHDSITLADFNNCAPTNITTDTLRDLSEILEPYVIVCEAFTLNAMTIKESDILQLRVNIGDQMTSASLILTCLYSVDTTFAGTEYEYKPDTTVNGIPLTAEVVKKTTFDVIAFKSMFPKIHMDTEEYSENGRPPYTFYNQDKPIPYNIRTQKNIYAQKHDDTNPYDKTDDNRNNSTVIKDQNGTIVLERSKCNDTILWLPKRKAPVVFLASTADGSKYVKLRASDITTIQKANDNFNDGIPKVSVTYTAENLEGTSVHETATDDNDEKATANWHRKNGKIEGRSPSNFVCLLCPKAMDDVWTRIVRKYNQPVPGGDKKYAYYPSTFRTQNNELPTCMYCGEPAKKHTRMQCIYMDSVFDKSSTMPMIT